MKVRASPLGQRLTPAVDHVNALRNGRPSMGRDRRPARPAGRRCNGSGASRASSRSRSSIVVPPEQGADAEGAWSATAATGASAAEEEELRARCSRIRRHRARARRGVRSEWTVSSRPHRSQDRHGTVRLAPVGPGQQMIPLLSIWLYDLQRAPTKGSDLTMSICHHRSLRRAGSGLRCRHRHAVDVLTPWTNLDTVTQAPQHAAGDEPAWAAAAGTGQADRRTHLFGAVWGHLDGTADELLALAISRLTPACGLTLLPRGRPASAYVAAACALDAAVHAWVMTSRPRAGGSPRRPPSRPY